MGGRKEKIWFDIAAAALLVLMGALAWTAALRESATFDEVAHVGAGVSYVHKLDLRFNEEHPPLSKVLAAAPLVARGVRADYSSPSWTVAERFVPAFVMQWIFGELLLTRWNDPAAVLAWMRFPMLLLTLALGWMIYAQAVRFGGPWGGLLCLSLYVSMPVFLAFGPLVVNDVALALFCLWSIRALADLWEAPIRKHAVTLGLAFGGALLTKFSAGILLLCFAACAISARWRPFPGQPYAGAERRAWTRLRWRQLGLSIAVAAAVVYAVYFLLSLGQPATAVDALPQLLTPLRRALLPAWLFLRGLLMMIATSSRPTFILGHAYPHGVWFYFPVVIMLKSPLGFLLLAALAAAAAVVLRRRDSGPVIPKSAAVQWRAVFISLVVFTAVLMFSRLNISIRHFSVPLTLLILILAPLPRLLTSVRARALVAFLAATCIATAAYAWPYYVPYMNALGGGREAFELLNDSNVDWNQGLYEVKRFAAERGMRRVKVDTYALSNPAAVVPGAEIWDCQAPAPDDAGTWVVLSANMFLDAHNCAWLLPYPREMLAGGSMFAVRLPTPVPAVGQIGGPPPLEARRLFMGMPVDARAMILQLEDHPETIVKAMVDMEAQFKAAMQKKR
jgi:4-amino-4-deoxy-L-arabinose transferase-like glycosyltransferase